MNDLPDITARRADGARLELDFSVAADCPWFAGHFPGHAILPGVVQIGWAAHFAAELLGHDEPPAQLERIKFRQPIGPGAQLTLHLQIVAGKVRYEYRLRDAGTIASSGVLSCVAAP